jgi:hypothetical protein
MTPLDQKTELHYRQCAMNAALTTHESQPQRSADEMLATAQKYFNFLAGNTMSADSAPMAVALRTPSGLPGDWPGADALPADTTLAGMPLVELQELRRRQLFELDTVAKAIKAQGAVPC